MINLLQYLGMCQYDPPIYMQYNTASHIVLARRNSIVLLFGCLLAHASSLYLRAQVSIYSSGHPSSHQALLVPALDRRDMPKILVTGGAGRSSYPFVHDNNTID